jgi:hypothetical protein
MTTIDRQRIAAWFERVSVRSGGNETARRHCACLLAILSVRTLQSASSPLKSRLMGRNADPLRAEPRIALSGVPASRPIAPAKSP